MVALEHSFLDLAKARQWDRLKAAIRATPGIVNAQPGGRWSALHQAAGAGSAEIVAYLLTHRANLNARTSCGKTAIDLATTESVRKLLKEAIDLLKTAGAATISGSGGSTSMFARAPDTSSEVASAPKKRLEVEHRFLDLAKTRRWKDMRTMLDAQPDLISVQPGGRWSALHQAASSGHAEAVKFLLARKAQVAAAASDGRRPLDVATSEDVKRLLVTPPLDAATGTPGTHIFARSLSSTSKALEVVSSDDEKTACGSAHAAASAASSSRPLPAEASPRTSPDKRARTSVADMVSPGTSPFPSMGADCRGEASSSKATATATDPLLLSPCAISCSKGTFEIRWGAVDKYQGSYNFDMGSRRLYDDTGGLVGVFAEGPTGCHRFSDVIIREPPSTMHLAFHCIDVVEGEIMEEIQKPCSAGAFFVLPSQLNGAEYPSDGFVVRAVEEYKADRTGGPRGQLAVHPAGAQFLLDNAACDNRPGGINAVDILLESVRASLRSSGSSGIYDLHVRNGYLAIPDCPASLRPHVLQALRASLHTMRCLRLLDVPACGLTPTLAARSTAAHRVNMVYASAVPVQTYLNAKGHDRALQEEVGRLIIAGQYYGALRAAADRGKCIGSRVRVILMPLGGGVFNNRPEVIAGAMATAVDLLSNDGVDVQKSLDIRLLTFRGKPTERARMEGILRKGSREDLGPAAPPPASDPSARKPDSGSWPAARVGTSEATLRKASRGEELVEALLRSSQESTP